MNIYQDKQVIEQLEKRKGGYFYLTVPASIVNQFKNKRMTRFLCTLEDELTFQCGLNHLGDGNFFVILGSKNLKTVGKAKGDTISFELREDPDPLGVPMPEVLTVLLEQDEDLRGSFDKLSLGKKRSVIHAVIRIKDIDKQVDSAYKAVQEQLRPRQKKNL